MIGVSWTILGAVVVFLLVCAAVLVAGVLEERALLRDTCKFLRGQRDDARRELCLYEANAPEWDARAVAKARGWDCFEDDR